MIELLLKRGSVTSAFMRFAQLLERLLFLRSKQERWLKQGFLQVPKQHQKRKKEYNPALGGLIRGWQRRVAVSEEDAGYQQLERIRLMRNELVHEGRSLSNQDLEKLWDWLLLGLDAGAAEELQPMEQVLSWVMAGAFEPPEVMLLRSLHRWGLTQLEGAPKS